MTFAVQLLNAVLTFLFGGVCLMLQGLGPLGSLTVISALAGILMVWVFGKVSNQAAIGSTRLRLSAELLALRLFKDDLRVFFGIQWQVLRWSIRYLRHSFVPMLILMAPTLLILIQLNLHYGARPLRVGEQALLKVKLRATAPPADAFQLTLQAPDILRVETEAVRIAELREVCWRVRGVSAGRAELRVIHGSNSVAKRVAVGGAWQGVSTLRTGEHWLTSLLYPGEAPIAGTAPIESIEIRYPTLDILLLGMRVDWLILFFVLSLASGFALKGVLGVKI